VQYQNTIQGMLQQLSSPKIVFLYVLAGDAVDSLLAELAAMVSPGDILVDGGNSYWGDSINSGCNRSRLLFSATRVANGNGACGYLYNTIVLQLPK
jgi:6-phosphogluconate dehydrogenase (decarboxylating)